MDVNALLKTLASVDKDSFNGDEAARVEARKAALALSVRLETPLETHLRVLWHPSMLYNALGVANDLKLFDILGSEDAKTPKTTDFIAEKASVEPELVQRMFRHLASMNVVEEVDQDLWRATSISEEYRKPTSSATIRLIEFFLVPLLSMPAHMRQTAHKVPTDPTNTAWQLGTGDSATTFDYFGKYPKKFEDFSMFLKGLAEHMPRSWGTLSDQTDRINDWIANEPGPVVLDIGGGHGQDLECFVRTYPAISKRLLAEEKDRLILLDRAEVISNLPASFPTGLGKRPIDFFAEPPPPNALFYHYSMILHDWPDAECRVILQHATSSMLIEKSRLLLAEVVVPRTKADPSVTSIDLVMMAQLGSKERTEDEWYTLIEGVKGLKIVEIHSAPGYPHSCIEVKRVA